MTPLYWLWLAVVLGSVAAAIYHEKWRAGAWFFGVWGCVLCVFLAIVRSLQ